MVQQNLIFNVRSSHHTAKAVWQGISTLCRYRMAKRGGRGLKEILAAK